MTHADRDNLLYVCAASFDVVMLYKARQSEPDSNARQWYIWAGAVVTSLAVLRWLVDHEGRR